MAWPVPQYSRGEVNRAGSLLASDNPDTSKIPHATEVLSNWRSCHGYPINTFQATLREKLKSIDRSALVAQRLKRTPSIINKLRRFPTMRLARMNDIGGLRAVLGSAKKVRDLEADYRASIFQHELVGQKDYINTPKESGYRSIHLIYKYNNARAEARPYKGLFVELQFRSQRQHAWATAVETMGAFLNRALKSSEGPTEWLEFFSLAGCAFAHLEKTAPVPGYEHLSEEEVYRKVSSTAAELGVIDRLRAFAIATDHIAVNRQPGSYRLVVLNLDEKTVDISTFPLHQLNEANVAYTKMEEKIQEGAPLQAVLVSTGSISNLRRAYPNYFLDTDAFIDVLKKINAKVKA